MTRLEPTTDQEKLNTIKRKLVALAVSKLGTPYVYNTNGPDTFDCSGFIVWLLREVGQLKNDKCAQDLFDMCEPTGAPWPADLVFYGESDKAITHVCLHLGFGRAIGCNGGDSTTTSIEEAKRRGAAVCIRDARGRRDFRGFRRYPWRLDDNGTTLR